MESKERWKKNYNKKYYLTHHEKELARSKITSKRRRERVGKEQIARENREHVQRTKILVLTHYGNGKLACVKCGFDDMRALSIDHIDGRGKRDRVNMGGSYFYANLKKKGYPDGYQTLCMNCNWIKRFENREHFKQ